MENSSTPIDATNLKRMLEEDTPPILVDARLEVDFQCSRLPEAVSNCVLEVEFPNRMAGLAPDRAAAVCVYGEGPGSFESRMAAEKLRRAGYTRVYDFHEGLDGWKKAGYPLVGEEMKTPAAPHIADGIHPIDLEASRVRWVGRNLLNSHEGTIGLKSGSLRVESGNLSGGNFTIDLRTIRSTDLEGNPAHDILIKHLMDLDFFDVGNYPEAVFEITGARGIPETTPGAANLHVSGMLSLRGNAEPLEFDACAGITPEGRLAAQAAFAFDRTLWGVVYGSGKWFKNPGGHLVNDLIELQVKIVTETGIPGGGNNS